MNIVLSPGLQHMCPESSAHEGHGTVRAGSEEATKIIRGLEQLFYKDKTERIGAVQPVKQKAPGTP